MKYLVRNYYSYYCTYEIEAENQDIIFKLFKELPINEEKVLKL